LNNVRPAIFVKTTAPSPAFSQVLYFRERFIGEEQEIVDILILSIDVADSIGNILVFFRSKRLNRVQTIASEKKTLVTQVSEKSVDRADRMAFMPLFDFDEQRRMITKKEALGATQYGVFVTFHIDLDAPYRFDGIVVIKAPHRYFQYFNHAQLFDGIFLFDAAPSQIIQ
jgi:hypothetical protein